MPENEIPTSIYEIDGGLLRIQTPGTRVAWLIEHLKEMLPDMGIEKLIDAIPEGQALRITFEPAEFTNGLYENGDCE